MSGRGEYVLPPKKKLRAGSEMPVPRMEFGGWKSTPPLPLYRIMLPVAASLTVAGEVEGGGKRPWSRVQHAGGGGRGNSGGGGCGGGGEARSAPTQNTPPAAAAMQPAREVGGGAGRHSSLTERAAVGGSNGCGGVGEEGERDQTPLPPQNAASGGGGNCGCVDCGRGRGKQAPPHKESPPVSAAMALGMAGKPVDMVLGLWGDRKSWKLLPRRRENGRRRRIFVFIRVSGNVLTVWYAESQIEIYERTTELNREMREDG